MIGHAERATGGTELLRPQLAEGLASIVSAIGHTSSDTRTPRCAHEASSPPQASDSSSGWAKTASRERPGKSAGAAMSGRSPGASCIDEL